MSLKYEQSKSMSLKHEQSKSMSLKYEPANRTLSLGREGLKRLIPKTEC